MNISPTEAKELMQAFLAMETLQNWQGHLIRKGMKLVERIDPGARKHCPKTQPPTQNTRRKMSKTTPTVKK